MRVCSRDRAPLGGEDRRARLDDETSPATKHVDQLIDHVDVHGERLVITPKQPGGRKECAMLAAIG